MSNNVRCDGQPQRGNLWDPPYRAPCGWKGERYSHLPGASFAKAAKTKKPCPRCGGRVELILLEDVQ